MYSTFAEGPATASPEEVARRKAEQARADAAKNSQGQGIGTGIDFIDSSMNKYGQVDRGAGAAMNIGKDTIGTSNAGVMDSQQSNGSYVGPDAQANAGAGGNGRSNYPFPDVQWGGEGGAANMSGIGMAGMGVANGYQSWAAGQAQKNRGAQAFENQSLADRESASRYGDQNGALQLARESAMGQAPSEAAFMMQRGLDQSLASQQAQMGSARGNAGIALAGQGAASNSANLMNQTYGQAGQLRANEMATARGLYGGLAGQQRDQDLNRLQQGSQMSQFNAGLNDQYKLGMANQANQFGNQAMGWYGAAQNPFTEQGKLDIAGHNIAADSQNQGNALAAGEAQAARDRRQQGIDRLWSFGGTVFNGAGQMYAAQSSKPQPPRYGL